ncbi:MAG: class I SAM-dependent methyltransferase [Acidobacteriota bacterium]|nr:class I SAM-dependent methyltransferase [Acidobacteriota bacterium]
MGPVSPFVLPPPPLCRKIRQSATRIKPLPLRCSVSSFPGPAVTPEPIFDALNAFQLTAAMKTAIEIDLFTGIAEGKTTPAALAVHCQAAERGVRILCDYLTVQGFLTKTDGHYGLTPTAATFLDRRSPAFIGSISRFLASAETLDIFKDLTPVVRNGGAVFQPGGTMAPEDPMWVEFARSMAPLFVVPSDKLAVLVGADEGKKWKVLDIAAGHGLYGLAIARHNPNAEIFPVDWAAVLEVARENAEKFGVADRFHPIPGSAFDVDFGEGYDVVLVTNFAHHFDPLTIEKLARKVHAALRPGGTAVLLEFIPNEDRISPPAPAKFSMIMLGNTPSGDAYTFSEYQRMLGNAGFHSLELHPLPPTFFRVILARK